MRKLDVCEAFAFQRVVNNSIVRVHARQIYDSRGNPAAEVEITTSKGIFRASVPSDASTTLELRNESVHRDKCVLKAIANINDWIGPALIAKKLDVTDQTTIDAFMHALDGTESKSTTLGANAILAVSICVCKAGAAHKLLPLYAYIAQLAGTKPVLPVPAFELLHGDAHARNTLAVREFMVLPVGAKSFGEALRIAADVYHCLTAEIERRYGVDATAVVGDERAFAPKIQDNKEALDLLNAAIALAGCSGKVKIGVNAAIDNFYKHGMYDLDFKNARSDQSKWLTGEQMSDLYKTFTSYYSVVSIEGAFGRIDWSNWQKFKASAKIQLVDGDLTVTNCKRIQKATDQNLCTCLLLKLNQMASVTEALQAANLARESGWGVSVAHCASDTEDTFIADFAVGLATGQMKTGAPCRLERLAKYNQLLRIEEELGNAAVYAGEMFHDPLA